jgi:hypothetical protein
MTDTPEIDPNIGDVIKQTGIHPGRARYFIVTGKNAVGVTVRWTLVPCDAKGVQRSDPHSFWSRLSACYYSVHRAAKDSAVRRLTQKPADVESGEETSNLLSQVDLRSLVSEQLKRARAREVGQP